MVDYQVSEISQLFANEKLDSYYDDDTREALFQARLHAFLLRKRLKRPISGVTNRQKKRSLVGHNRNADRIARSKIIKAKRRKKNSHHVSRLTLLAKMQPSILLDGLVDKRSVRWVPMSHRLSSRDETSIRVNNFSFLTNPNETLRTLSLIAEAETTCLSAQIDFLDAHCKDIGPWLVLAAMRSEMAPIFTGGKISRDMSRVISALGLDKALGFSLSYADALKLPRCHSEAQRPALPGARA